MTRSATHTARPTVLRGSAANDAAKAMGVANLSTFEDVRSAMNPENALALMEAERAAARERGYAEGLEAARADVMAATEDANQRVHRALAALCEAVEEFDRREATALADVEDAIIAGSFSIARAVLQREVSTMTDPGAEALARAMQLIPARGDIVARFHPMDVETLSMQNVSTGSRSVHVVADVSVEPGGCIVEIGNTNVDAQLSSALANVGGAIGLSPELGDKNHDNGGFSHPVAKNMTAGSSLSNSRTTSMEAPNS